MKSLKDGDILLKSITRDGALVDAQCKFTPFAEDGKEFHCEFSPSITTSEMDQTTPEPFETAGETTETFETILASGSITEGSGSEEPASDARNQPTPKNLEPAKAESSPSPFFVQVSPGGSPAVKNMAPQGGDESSGEPLCQTLDTRCRKVINAIGNFVSPSNGVSPQHCKPLDEACRTLRGKLLFSPQPPAKTAAPPLSDDPCTSESECVSWRFLRTIAAPFLAALKGPEVALDRFPKDDTTLFSAAGAKLYRLALSQASDSQRIDNPYLLRMVYRTQLDSLLQIRYARVEMQSSLSQMLWLSVGLALPSVLLSSIYLLIHLRWAIVNRREKMQAKRASRDQRLLQEYQRGEAAPRPLSNERS